MGHDPVRQRATHSFFTMPGGRPGSPAVCRGLSCELHGAAMLCERIAATGCTPTGVYCLGRCSDSPALFLEDGTVLSGARAQAWPAAPADDDVKPPAIRVASRQPIVTERLRHGNHSTVDIARRAGVYEAFASALRAPAELLLATLEASGHRGRGGAAFPTGRKWRVCAQAAGGRRYVVANGDEGDPGAFIDRLLLEDDPHAVLEGLLICGLAIGATDGIIYIRAEYPAAIVRMERAVVEARAAGLLGTHILGSRFSFDVSVVHGKGSYVCGEETALINALEGKRGEVRVRPPYPTTHGLHGQPTVVNNIETLVNVPWIMRHGAEAYRALGTKSSPGTKAFCFNRGFAQPGIVEAEFGIGLADLILDHGGGGAGGEVLAAVVLGGPMGSVLTPAQWSVRIDYDALHEQRIELGHGGLVAIPRDADLRLILQNWVRFMAEESCGRCVPCGLGSQEAVGLVERWMAEWRTNPDSGSRLEQLMEVVEKTSLCGFGQGIARPIRTVARLIAAKAASSGFPDE